MVKHFCFLCVVFEFEILSDTKTAMVSNMRTQITFSRLESLLGTNCVMHVCSFMTVLTCELCDEGFPVAVKDGYDNWAFCCVTCVRTMLPDDVRINIYARPGSLDANHSGTSHDVEFNGGEGAPISTCISEYEEDWSWSESETS